MAEPRNITVFISVQEFAKRLSAADAFFLSSPEYNASMPGAVKNLIDWASPCARSHSTAGKRS